MEFFCEKKYEVTERECKYLTYFKADSDFYFSGYEKKKEPELNDLRIIQSIVYYHM